MSGFDKYMRLVALFQPDTDYEPPRNQWPKWAADIDAELDQMLDHLNDALSLGEQAERAERAVAIVTRMREDLHRSIGAFPDPATLPQPTS